MAEDGEEMGQVQEQWEGEYITLMHGRCLSLCDIPDSVRQSSVCAIGLHVYLHVELVLFFLLLGSGGFPFFFFLKRSMTKWYFYYATIEGVLTSGFESDGLCQII